MAIKRTREILLIHPEGNILFNNGLMSLVFFLREEGFSVDYLCPSFHGASVDAFQHGINKLFVSKRLFSYVLKWRAFLYLFTPFLRFTSVLTSVPSWKLIIGVDRDGIIIGDILAKAAGLPSVLISYEIFFKSETSAEYKKPEITACRNISFAICQGGERSHQLSIENKIPRNKIIDIPVSGRNSGYSLIKSLDLKEHFQITHTYVAVMAGSLESWTLIDELVECTQNWPREWGLLIHSRYGLDSARIKELQLLGSNNIYFSDLALGSHQEASNLLCQADIGIALYKPTYKDRWVGNNLAYLGLSSGKTAMYLQGGLPVLTTPFGDYPKLLREYDAGFVIDNLSQISPILLEYPSRKSSMRRNARVLFEERIDSNLFRQEFLKSISEALG